MPAPFEAVVFDLDGTLIDTAPDLHFYLNEILHELGRPGLALDRVRPMIGDGVRALLQRGLEASGGMPAMPSLDQLFATFLERYTAAPARFSAPFDGLVEVLTSLAEDGVRLGVCTNKPQQATDRLLSALDMIGHFGAVLGGDALPVKKPDPGMLQAVLQRLGVAASRAAMVGDSQNDLLTARGVGVPCILVSFGYTATPARALGADRVIDAFAELPGALAELGRDPA